MPITIASNIAALQAGRRLAQSTGELRGVFEHLSSGLRINRASDDAAGLAIADSLRVDVRVANQGVKNLNDGLSVASIADDALGELSNITIRLRELAEQASNGTLGNAQRTSLDKEAQALAKEYFRIARTTSFNGLNLFDGSIQALTIQSGYGVNGGVTSSLGGVMGDGSFGVAVTYDIAHQTQSLDAADLNGDGLLDLVAGGGGATTAILLGNGDGTFKAANTYLHHGATVAEVTLGDVNGDGILDHIATGSTATGVRFGNGDGTFKASTSYAMVADSVTTADFNSDGALDFVLTAESGAQDGITAIYLNRGDGTFQTAITYFTLGARFRDLVAEDINADGIIDLVGGGVAGASDSLSIMLGNGDGTFKRGASYSVASSAIEAVVLGDFNGDNFLDALTSGGAGATAISSLRLGRGDGTFGSATSYTVGIASSFGVATGDLNGDGALDFAASVFFGGDAAIFLGNGNGSFRAQVSYTSPTGGSFTLATGDFSGDGVFDLVVGGYAGINSMAIHLGNTQAGIGQILPFSLRTLADARQSLSVLERAQQNLVVQRGKVGALQSRLTTATNNVRVAAENYTSAESQLRDVDVAQESARLVRLNILQQAGASILAQSNIQPRIALDLLSG